MWLSLQDIVWTVLVLLVSVWVGLVPPINGGVGTLCPPGGDLFRCPPGGDVGRLCPTGVNVGGPCMPEIWRVMVLVLYEVFAAGYLLLCGFVRCLLFRASLYNASVLCILGRQCSREAVFTFDGHDYLSSTSIVRVLSIFV